MKLKYGGSRKLPILDISSFTLLVQITAEQVQQQGTQGSEALIIVHEKHI